MRRAAAFAGVVLLVAASACEQKNPFAQKPPDPAPSANVATASGLAEALGVDAGPLDLVDPPAPAGDLAKDLEQFVNVETCVAQRASLDPLLADALRAIGYDTFVRDACRLLEAAKDKKRETCEKIDASSLRARCKTWVAILAQTPDACPLLYEGLPSRGRAATCVALAGKDPRMCAAEPRPTQRTTCEAMSARDGGKCASLAGVEKASCAREVARWKSLLPSPLEGLPKLADASGRLAVHGESGTPEPKTTDVDLAPDVARGAVVVVGLRDRMKVEIGMLGDTDTARIAGAPNKRTRVGALVSIDAPRGTAKEGTPSLERFELEVPGELPIVAPPGKCECKVTRARVDKARGGAVSLALEGTVTGAGKSYRVSMEVSTFVRDVVAEDAAALPTLPGLGGRR